MHTVLYGVGLILTAVQLCVVDEAAAAAAVDVLSAFFNHHKKWKLIRPKFRQPHITSHQMSVRYASKIIRNLLKYTLYCNIIHMFFVNGVTLVSINKTMATSNIVEQMLWIISQNWR